MSTAPDTAAAPSVKARAATFGLQPILLLAATMALPAAEVQAFSQAVDGTRGIQAYFHVSDLAIGMVPFVMSVIGVVGTIPAGILTDRARRLFVMAGLLAAWTVVEGANGLAIGFAAFLVLRVIVSITESTNPIAVSLIADYYPVLERGRMMGLYQLGAVIGSIAGAIVAGALMGAAGWRWTFYVWIPAGIAVTLWALAQPEPPRGERDAEFERQLVESEAEHGVPTHRLPAPARTSAVDYTALEGWAGFRELWRARTFRLGTLALVVVQMLPLGLALWAIPFFKRVHHLSATTAGSVTGLLAAGTIVGVLAGGVIADRLLERGVINARVWVFLVAAVASGLAFMPAFAVPSTVAAAVLFFVAATFLGITMAPGETMVADVIVAPLRGRASTIRFSAGAVSASGAAIIGGLSSVLGLQHALIVFSPILVLGGLLAVPALRSYGPDVAFVVAESKRARLAAAIDSNN